MIIYCFVGGYMYKKKQIIDLYNEISEEKIDSQILSEILPKLYLIMNKKALDEVEIISIIDVLKEFKNKKLLDKINVESIDLINKIVENNINSLDGTLYYSSILKYVLEPFNQNKCDKDYNIVLFLSEFEIFIELIYERLNKKDLAILSKYNNELVEIVKNYGEIQNLYKQVVYHDVILSSMVSHFTSILYFKLDDYDYNYNILKELFQRLIDNYQNFIDYCCSLGIQKNYNSFNTDMFNIELEYKISNDMLEYVYDSLKEEKIKRK